MRVLIGTVLCAVCLWAPLLASAATSESYILDSAIIGPVGTHAATSTNYQTDNTGFPVFYEGETIADDEESEDGGGGGRRFAIMPSALDSYIYTETNPLILRDFQSGTLALTFVPTAYASLYVPPHTFGPNETVYHLERRAGDAAELPAGISPAHLIDGYVYTVSAESDLSPVTTLDRFITLIIENDALGAIKDTESVYYYHPNFHAWIKLAHAVFTDDAVIFQTPYATKYMLVRGDAATAPPILRTDETPAVTDEEIRDSVREDESNAVETEIKGPTVPQPEAIPEYRAEPIMPSLLDIARAWYQRYFLSVGALIALCLILLLYILHKRQP